jgi:hypothetical protein
VTKQARNAVRNAHFMLGQLSAVSWYRPVSWPDRRSLRLYCIGEPLLGYVSSMLMSTACKQGTCHVSQPEGRHSFRVLHIESFRVLHIESSTIHRNFHRVHDAHSEHAGLQPAGMHAY